jgi:hypothetical protein
LGQICLIFLLEKKFGPSIQINWAKITRWRSFHACALELGQNKTEPPPPPHTHTPSPPHRRHSCVPLSNPWEVTEAGGAEKDDDLCHGAGAADLHTRPSENRPSTTVVGGGVCVLSRHCLILGCRLPHSHSATNWLCMTRAHNS